ncbi:MAG: redoxin family protein [Terriglobia bacterium]
MPNRYRVCFPRFVGALTLLAFLVSLAAALAAQEPAPKAPKPAGEAMPQSAADAESEALDKIFQAPSTDPQAEIQKLEDFLTRFPASAYREQVLRVIQKRALESNDAQRAAGAMERLVALHPEDPDLLSAAADLLDRQGDDAGRARALEYATRFVERAEKMTVDSRPPSIPADKWPEVQPLVRASAYALRGRIYAKAGESDHAVADFEKSLAAYTSTTVAEQLGDASLKMGDTTRAIDAYATAFALPDRRTDPARRDQVRKKLGSAYVAKYQSEKGLGDLVMARYDELMRTLAGRFKPDDQPRAESQNALEVPLRRPDGSTFTLAELRGKTVVMDFWATWCPPCRVEGGLFERVIETFRNDPRVAFLSINADEDRAAVADFLKAEKWNVPVAFAQGLDQMLGIRALPTTMILDPEGRVVFRQTGLDLSTFVPTLEGKIREILKSTESAQH